MQSGLIPRLTSVTPFPASRRGTVTSFHTLLLCRCWTRLLGPLPLSVSNRPRSFLVGPAPLMRVVGSHSASWSIDAGCGYDRGGRGAHHRPWSDTYLYTPIRAACPLSPLDLDGVGPSYQSARLCLKRPVGGLSSPHTHLMISRTAAVMTAESWGSSPPLVGCVPPTHQSARLCHLFPLAWWCEILRSHPRGLHSLWSASVWARWRYSQLRYQVCPVWD